MPYTPITEFAIALLTAKCRRTKRHTHTHTQSTEGGESSSWSEVDLRASSELDRRSCMALFFFDVDEGCQEALAGCD